MGHKTYQQWCIDTLVHILTDRENYRITYGDQGFKYVLKVIISHYASMYYVGEGVTSKRKNGLCRNHLNIWWDHLNDKNAHYFFSTLIMSSAAHTIYNEVLNMTTGSFTERRKKLKCKLHIEHITPTEYIYDKLEKLSAINESEVKRSFAQNKVILITKDESASLDGKGSVFKDEDLQLIQMRFPEVWPQYQQAANRVNGKSPKSQGFGLLRMARLYNSGVRFVYGCNGADVEMSEWMNYLDDHANIIKAIPADNV